ncbi:hypothetical protein EZY14_008950 [Kordia sp. TARA_039_SRF]|nr:hypothetical protein EZY14_008950 [Kordia sp. TARA_039_SRF]
MIQICSGTPKAIYYYISKTYTTADAIIINGSDEFSLPFLVIRQAIPILKQRLGAATVSSTLKDYKLLINTLYKDSSYDFADCEKYNRITASLSSNITHSRVAKDTLIRESAEILCKLIRNHNLRLIIPDVRHLDTGSIDVLRHLYHVSSETAPDIVIGYDPNWGDTIFDDELGISWYRSVDSVTIFQAFINALTAKATSVKTVDEVTETLSTIKKYTPQLDAEDEALEWKIFQKTKHIAQIELEQDAVAIFNAIEKCFRLFDFTNTLSLSLKVLATIESHLSELHKGQLYHMIGLSAHNRHFFSQQNEPLAIFLLDTFKKAVQYEKDAARKTAILYRLIVTTSRRLNDISLASKYLQEAYNELETGDFSGYHQPILSAWIYNIHSFILMKKREIDTSIDMQAKGFYLLEELEEVSEKETAIEIEYTKAVLAENLATLHSITENFEAMEFWYGKEVAFTQKWPSLHATSFAEWQSFFYQNLQLKQALQKTEQGITQSQDSFNYILEYFFTLSAADINYRLGNITKAIEYFKRAIVMQSQIDHSYISAEVLQRSIIKSHLQAAEYSAVISLLQQLQVDEKASIESHVEHNCLFAICYAKINDKATSEKYMNIAIDMAVQSGEANLLLKVCIAGGMISETVAKEEAIGFYNKALEIAEVSIDGNTFQPNAEDLVKLHLGLYKIDNQQTSHVFMALNHLEKSLKKSADIWKELKTILKLLLSLPEETLKKYIAKNEQVIANMIKAASQRDDCEEELNAFLKITTTHQNT